MDDLIVKFCEDRRSWLVVIAGTLLLGLLLVLPGVDDYVAVCAEKDETANQLARSEDSAAQVDTYEARVEEKNQELKQQLDKTLHEENVTEYRNSMVKLVRDSGFQLRRLAVGGASSRAWGEQDQPLEKTYNKKLTPTGYQLEKRNVNLSLTGPASNLRRLLDRFEKHETQVHLQRVDLRPSGGDGSRVELSMELWYFTLRRGEA